MKLYRETERRFIFSRPGILSRRGAGILIICRQKLREEDIRNFSGVREVRSGIFPGSQAPVEQDEAVGHAVREMYMCSAMADLAGEDADSGLWKLAAEFGRT